MAVIWAPETVADFARIHAFNTEAFGRDEADRIEQFILDAGEQLESMSGWPWKALPIRKAVIHHPRRRERLGYQYMFFFRTGPVQVEIIAVYHAREDWTALVPGRT